MPLYTLADDRPVLPAKDRFWIAPGAQVVGRVRIGADVGVWFNAVIRADNDWIEIGEGTNIQDNATLHADPGFPLKIGRFCTVGHRAMLHGCTVGENTLVGMGATVLNGARIGANCVIGANALVTEGKEFPDGTLIVGTPAQAKRAVDPAMLERIRNDTLAYIAKWQRYVRELRPAE
jgi:carbonic anhydrase/acetyltransferase-like protein (isoleucine patch superfamily)